MKRTNSYENSLIRQLGLNVIPDLERREVDSLPQIPQEELIRDCMNRNRGIQAQIKRYNQLYRAYNNRSPKKKNSSYLHFKPTICLDDCTSPSTPSKKPIKEYREYSFQKKRASLYEPFQVANAEASDEKLKEEVLTQIYETRQKCCLKKVVVLGTELFLRPISAIPTKKPISSTPTKWARPKSGHKSKFQKELFSKSMSLRKN